MKGVYKPLQIELVKLDTDKEYRIVIKRGVKNTINTEISLGTSDLREAIALFSELDLKEYL